MGSARVGLRRPVPVPAGWSPAVREVALRGWLLRQYRAGAGHRRCAAIAVGAMRGSPPLHQPAEVHTARLRPCDWRHGGSASPLPCAQGGTPRAPPLRWATGWLGPTSTSPDRPASPRLAPPPDEARRPAGPPRPLTRLTPSRLLHAQPYAGRPLGSRSPGLTTPGPARPLPLRLAGSSPAQRKGAAERAWRPAAPLAVRCLLVPGCGWRQWCHRETLVDRLHRVEPGGCGYLTTEDAL
ncbi:hypothetical protein DFR72_120156 [Lentzea flaviverrucosa]|uniref:Uncharacterized protein n=1 Tax=Lentzea flaviverrucosa TaxID=200379 RepID=A0A1H9KNR9_9PSEU|nr:hypothetical protein DFR72_120156 [Lentzea flaviverrucosa]SER00585.1 hypothetical protein SAMN05216195_103655 [Lentzea flaviverrucosa]